MAVPAEITQGLLDTRNLARNVIKQYSVSGDFTISTCWGTDNSPYVGLDISVKSAEAGTLILDGQRFTVEAGGISLESVYYDRVQWQGGAAVITIEGTTFNVIQARLGAPTPRGENVLA